LRFVVDQGDTDLAQVGPPTVERWSGSVRDLSDARACRALNRLSSLFKWATSFGHTPTNALDLVQGPRRRSRVQPCPSPEGVRATLDVTQNLNERVALLALATSGLRRAELLDLRWSNVDLPRRLRLRSRGDK